MAPNQVIPTHLAIVCDGNRRWARTHKLQVFQGHEHAVKEVFEPLIDHAQARGIKFLTFWVFSTDNWDRDPAEIKVLMDLFRGFYDRQVDELHQKNVRVNMIGSLAAFASDIQERILDGMAKTKDNTGITVTLAMNYGGRDELLRAARVLAQKVADGEMTNADITEETIGRYLDTGGYGLPNRAVLPDPDLIVRTSGEQRLSGYLLWQMEYAELWFPSFHFPEFTPSRLDEAIEEFNRRQRRFGK